MHSCQCTFISLHNVSLHDQNEVDRFDMLANSTVLGV